MSLEQVPSFLRCIRGRKHISGFPSHFLLAWYFPDELSCRTLVIISEKRDSALVEGRREGLGTPVTQTSLDSLASSRGSPLRIMRSQFNTIKLHSSLSTRGKVKEARGTHLWLTLSPGQIRPVSLKASSLPGSCWSLGPDE